MSHIYEERGVRVILALLLGGCHDWASLLIAPDGGMLGTQCSTDDQCASRHCVDSVCCNSLCEGQCQACNLTVQGECHTVTSGPPRGTRDACNGGGSDCQGSCDGTSEMACHHPAGRSCGSACDGKCDDSGGCSAASMGSCPGGFACGAGACLTSCGKDQDCQPGFRCNMMVCERPGEADCLDGADDNSDGKPDCQDPTCDTRVMCVPAPAGAELGLFTDQPCPSPYATDEKLFQSPAPNGTCSGCTCTPGITCRYDLTYSSTDSMCTSPSPFATLFASNKNDSNIINAPCASVAPALNPKSVNVTRTRTSTACSHDAAQAVPDPPAWTVSRSFCAVTRSSATCQSGELCVARPIASAEQCARVGMPLASCPANYPLPRQTWYAANQYQEHRTCTCTCIVAAAGDCLGIVYLEFGNTCPLGTGTGNILITDSTTCEWSSGTGGFNHWSSIGGIQVKNGAGGNATCTNTGTAAGTVTPINGSTVCCR